ncbi:MAG: hypothetical protein EAX90_15980 [Candidatus Heimdallarchaeota archaeon]|nr:hypothetical protein [Candidatus Heimdallarchaeota archaeon]
MNQEKCSFCNGDLVTVNGELICTTCGLVNKLALENKENYLSPSFYLERKLNQERANNQRKHTINHIRSDIAYIVNFVELSSAVQNQAYLIVLDILKNERKVSPNFPWNENSNNLSYNCLLALCVIVAIKKVIGEYKQISGILEFYRNRGEELLIDNIKEFISKLSYKYDYLDDLFENCIDFSS